MAFNPAALAAMAAGLRESGAVVARPRSVFKVTTKMIGKRPDGTEEDHDRAWWVDYERQNR